MGNESRDKMLETAGLLFRKQGYNATGLNQILTESGTPKGSLYYHFPGGKEQLGQEAMDAAAQEMGRKIYTAFESTKSFQEAMEIIIDNAAADLEDSDFECGCPIATVALEATPGPVLQACCTAFQAAQKILESRLLMEGFSPASSVAMATLMFSAYEGAVILSRTQRTSEPLRSLKTTLPRLLGDDRN